MRDCTGRQLKTSNAVRPPVPDPGGLPLRLQSRQVRGQAPALAHALQQAQLLAVDDGLGGWRRRRRSHGARARLTWPPPTPDTVEAAF
jgi:hypothetical protein